MVEGELERAEERAEQAERFPTHTHRHTHFQSHFIRNTSGTTQVSFERVGVPNEVDIPASVTA